MRRRVTILFGWAIGILVILFLAAWIFLATSFFAEFRRSFVADILSDQIGQTLIIQDDVAIDLGPISRLSVSGVEIPSETIDGVNLAQLETLQLDVDLVALWKGAIDLDNLIIDGLQVNMLTHADGAQSWEPIQSTSSDGTPKETNSSKSEKSDLTLIQKAIPY